MPTPGLQCAHIHASLATPIEFADLERRGVLERAMHGWFVLRQPKALLAYAC